MYSFAIILAWLMTGGLVITALAIDTSAAKPKKGAPLLDDNWPPPVKSLKQQRPILPESPFALGGYIFVLIIIPIICFIIAWNMPTGTIEWQSDRLADYANIMLGGSVNAIFYPFTLYAMGAFLLLVFDQESAAESLTVRLGIYTGFLLALHYTIMVSAAGLIILGFLFPISVGIVLLFYAAPKFWHSKAGLYTKAGMALLLSVIAVLFLVTGAFLVVALVALVTLIYWALPLAAILSWRLIDRYERPLFTTTGERLLSALWLGSWFVTWQQAILTTLSLYESLPTAPPDCYIATAASQGNPTVVGSQPVTCANGQVLWVNRQLQICKAAELALKTIAPRLHAPLRGLYDLIGRPLARRINRPWLANGVYWSLKPFEWLAYALLRLFVRKDEILRLYR